MCTLFGKPFIQAAPAAFFICNVCYHVALYVCLILRYKNQYEIFIV